MVQKPTTMLMDEFKQNFIELMNNSQLPAWVLIYLMEPFMAQLRQFDEAARVKEREEYQKALEEENQKIRKGIEALGEKKTEG